MTENKHMAYLAAVAFCNGNGSLAGAKLHLANLRQANLQNADLSGVYLFNIDLEHANLYGADLSGVSLVNADLNGADLTGADLQRANLRGADLTGAKLTGVKNLTYEQVSDCFLDEKDKFWLLMSL